MKIRGFCLGALLLLCAGGVQAESFWAPHARPASPRVQAMGGSFVALANDSLLLHYNPAGLLHERKFGYDRYEPVVSIMDFGLRYGHGDRKAFDSLDWASLVDTFFNPATFTGKTAGFPSVRKINSKDKDWPDYSGEVVGAGGWGPLHLAYLGRGWGVSAYSSMADASAYPINKTLPSAKARALGLSAVSGGYAWPFTMDGGDLYVGVSGRLQSVSFIDADGSESLGSSSLPMGEDAFDDFLREAMYTGYGLAVDTGAIWKASPSWHWGVSLANTLAFLKPQRRGEFTGEHYRLPSPVLTMGVKYEPNFVKKALAGSFMGAILTDVRLLADYAVHVQDFWDMWSFYKGWHVGIETGWFRLNSYRSLLYVRGGFNQGYWTAGMGLDLLYVRLDYAFYQREMGTFPGDIRESSHTLSIKVEWR